jgi:hypothetical protein
VPGRERGKFPARKPVELFMRKVIVLLALLAASRALAAPARSCRIVLERGGFDVGCLPALSARGTLVAVATIDADGNRGRPNLQVTFFPVDGRPPASTTVLTVAEVDELGGGQLSADLVEKIQSRLDLVNAQLSFAGFAALKAEKGGPGPSVKDGVLEVRGRRFDLPPPPPDCRDASAAVSGVWTSADGDLVVRLDYACHDPRPAWRVLHIRIGADGGAAEQASALNTRGMKKFRAKDWVGAAADFRSAIELFSDHVKAHYNLACLASITRDRATALEQLRWLAASHLPEAEEKIVKARTDPDLSFIRSDPDGLALLGGSK